MGELKPPAVASQRSSLLAQGRPFFRGDTPPSRKSLRRLSARHKAIITMHLQGKKGTDIARTMGCTAATVYSIIKDPLSQRVIEHFTNGFDSDLKALFPLVIDAVRDGLESQDKELRLKAVDRFQKLTGRGEQRGERTSVNVNIIGDVRARLVNEIKQAADPDVLEAPGELLDTE